MLERLGYRVLTAPRPSEAVKLAASAQPGGIQLLMTDVVMPEMNGRELAANIEQIDPDVKILYMSGYTANVIAHGGILEEGLNFINKPFSKEDAVAEAAADTRRESLKIPNSVCRSLRGDLYRLRARLCQPVHPMRAMP